VGLYFSFNDFVIQKNLRKRFGTKRIDEKSSEQLCHLRCSNRFAEFYILMTKLHDHAQELAVIELTVCHQYGTSSSHGWQLSHEALYPIKMLRLMNNWSVFRGHCPF
jgi:hypothetical protein